MVIELNNFLVTHNWSIEHKISKLLFLSFILLNILADWIMSQIHCVFRVSGFSITLDLCFTIDTKKLSSYDNLFPTFCLI